MGSRHSKHCLFSTPMAFCVGQAVFSTCPSQPTPQENSVSGREITALKISGNLLISAQSRVNYVNIKDVAGNF